MALRIAWVLLSLLYLFFRIQNTPGVLTDHGIVLNDTDPYYRLHRIESMVTDNLVYPLHDPSLSFPHGFDVPWPTGLDLIIALPLRLFGVTDPTVIDSAAALAIPLLSLPTLWLLGFIATRIAGGWIGIIVGLVLTLSPAHIHASSIGYIDHHVLEAEFTIMALALLVWVRERPGRFGWVSLAALLAFGPSFWPQAWIVALFLAASALIDRKEFRPKTLSVLFFASSVASLAPLSLSNRFATGTISVFGFSWWAPIFYGALAIGFEILHQIRIPSPQKRAVPWGLILYAGAAMLFLISRGSEGSVAAQTSQGVNALRAEGGIISITSEAVSPLRLNPDLWLSLGLIPFALAWIWFPIQAFRRKQWWLVGFVAGPLGLAMAQIRFAALASPIIALCAVLLLYDLIRLMRKPKIVLPCVAALSLLMVYHGHPEAKFTSHENAHPFFRAVKGAARYIREELRRRPDHVRNRAVVHHWDYGHWMLHEAGVPVVAHPFQDYTALETLALFVSPEVDSLDRFIERFPVRYVLLESPTGRMEKWLQVLGKDLSSYFENRTSEDGRRFLQARPEFYRLMLPRWYLRGGQRDDGSYPAHWRLVYASPQRAPERKDLSAVKMFEHVPGASLIGRTKRKEVLLSTRIDSIGGSIYFEQRSLRDSLGNIAFTVPYGETRNGNVRFNGRYEFRLPDGKVLATSPVIREEDVLTGNLIDVGRVD